MELLFVTLFAILIGIAARYAAGRRSMSGALLVPGLAGTLAMIIWVALSFLGRVASLGWLAYDRGWIWGITLGATALLSFAIAFATGRRRERRDDELFDQLSHFGRAAV